MMCKQLLLASQSPRRREMITWLKLPVHTTRADVDERQEAGVAPTALVVRLASAKAHAVKTPADTWILAADTIVDLEHQALGKPQTPAEARKMLNALRDQPHEVHTGVVLYNPTSNMERARRVTTRVQMRAYTDAEIDRYIASRDPMDKAGAYAIQHPGFHPVDQVQHCYANVVGLPLCAVAALLNTWNYTLHVNIPQLCHHHFGYACPAPDQGVSL